MVERDLSSSHGGRETKVVALAGVGGLGSHVLEVMLRQLSLSLSSSPSPSTTTSSFPSSSSLYQPLVLTRKNGGGFSLSHSFSAEDEEKVLVEPVDYQDVEDLRGVFVKHKVYAVVSFLNLLMEPKIHQQVHENMIRAAEIAGVKRFIPSEWATDVRKFPDFPALYSGKIPIREALARSSSLEYTLPCTGLFMDYLLPPGGKKFLKDVSIPVNIQKRIAKIPGTGNEAVTLTAGEDIGKAVVWLLDRPKGSWPIFSYIRGETTTWNQVLQEAERVIGVPFSVEYVPEEMIEREIAIAREKGNPLPLFYAEVDALYSHGALGLPEGEFEGEVRERMTVSRLIRESYSSSSTSSPAVPTSPSLS